MGANLWDGQPRPFPTDCAESHVYSGWLPDGVYSLYGVLDTKVRPSRGATILKELLSPKLRKLKNQLITEYGPDSYQWAMKIKNIGELIGDTEGAKLYEEVAKLLFKEKFKNGVRK